MAKLTGSLPRNSSGKHEIVFSTRIYKSPKHNLVIQHTHQQETRHTFRSFFSFAVSFGLAPFFFVIFTPDLPEAPEIAVAVVVLAAYVISCSVVSVIAVLSASA